MTIKIDETKGFMLYQDNEDGTVTFTSKHPNSEKYPEVLTMVLQMDLVTLMGKWEEHIPDEAADELLSKALYIPDDPKNML